MINGVSNIMKTYTGKCFSKRFALMIWSAIAFSLVMGLCSGQAFAQYRSFGETGGDGASSSGPNLAAVTQEVEGGAITVGSTAYVVILFRNSGSLPVELGAINLYPSSTVSAAVSLNQCAREPLPAGADCAITVAISGLQVGSYRVELLADHSGRTRLATASVRGTVESGGDQQSGQSELEAFPEIIDFGSVTSGVEQVRSVTLRNKTSEVISISDVFIESSPKSGYSHRSGCSELQPGEACIATVTWSPRVRGESNGSLVLHHSGITGITRIDLLGNYQPEASSDALIYPDAQPDTGLLVSDKSQFDFGAGVESVSSMTASLVNVGDEPLILHNIRLSGAENGLSISRSGCRAGLELLPTEACPLTLSWAAVREGSLLDDLQVHHSGARGILVLPVRGSADSTVTRDSRALRSADGADGFELTPNLDGYVVTSLSARNAVISGPVGTLIVRDGESVVIGGISWQVEVKGGGVELDNGFDSILLIFDRSLTPNRFKSSRDDRDSDDND